MLIDDTGDRTTASASPLDDIDDLPNCYPAEGQPETNSRESCEGKHFVRDQRHACWRSAECHGHSDIDASPFRLQGVIGFEAETQMFLEITVRVEIASADSLADLWVLGSAPGESDLLAP